MKTKKFFTGVFTSLVVWGVVLCGSFFNFGIVDKAMAADGSGTNIVIPSSVTASSTGNAFTFTYTASETMDSGGISITVPAGGWSVPQGNMGVAGYTTASSTGTIADVKNNLDSSTGWAVTKHMTLSADTGDKVEGSASLSNIITSQAAANEQWYFDDSTMNWGQILGSTNLKVGMWLKSNVVTSAGDISWQDDNSSALGSPLDTVSIPALSASTWTYTSVELGAKSRTSINSYGFRYTNDIGAATVKVDDISVIFHAADSNSGWSGDGGISDSFITGAGNFMEGTGAVRCTYGGSAGTGSSGDCYDSEGGIRTVGPGTIVNFWIRSSVALNVGDFAFIDDNSSNVSSPDDIIDLPAIPANTWTYVSVNAPSSGNLRSFGVRQMVDVDPVTIDLDGFSKRIDACDSTTNWTVPTFTVQTLATDNGVFHEGNGSLRNTIASTATAGDKWYESLDVEENWSSYTTAGFWIRSSVTTSAGQLKFEYASSNDLTSPIASIDIGALSANTWTYQKLALTGTRTSVSSYGINYATDIGAATIYLDDVLLGPGIPGFSGSDITVPMLSLSSGQTVTVTYGAGGGVSGVTAPSTPGAYIFTTKSRAGDSGTLTNIASSPAVAVKQTTSTSLMTSGSPEVYGMNVIFTATVTPTSGPAPSGDVTFKDGVTTIGTGTLNGANPGVATLVIDNLSVSGSPHSVTAVYEGDANYSGSTSNAVSQAITPKNLTVTGITADDKVYDGNTSVALNVAGAALVGIVGGDTVILDSGSVVGTFDNKNVGIGKMVTVSGLVIGGASASNYTLTQPTPTASITAKNLTVTGITADDKVYNGNTAAVLNVAGAVLVGVVGGDTVILNTGSAVGTFDTSDIGVGKTVTVSGLTISGTDSGNYTLTQPTTTASITAATLTISGVTANNKVYDGNTSAVLNVGEAALVGVAMGDDVTLNTGFATGTFADKNVDTGKTVTTSGFTISGTDAGKYTLTQPTTTASIIAKNLTVNSITADDKVYDRTTSAALNIGGASLVGVVGGDSVALDTGSAIGTFTDKGVGAGKTVTISGLTISGTDSGNYSLTQPTTTASITAKNLTVTGITAEDKVHDGNTTATLNVGGAVLVGVISSDSVTLDTISAAGTFDTPDVDVGKIVTISGLTISGTDSGNYSLTQPTTTASITSVPIVATKFVIVQPADAQVGDPITVTVRAEDNSGNLDVSYNNVVTLFSTGSTTGVGVVTVTNGVGTIVLNNTIAETVTLFLVDSNGTGLDVSSTRAVSWTSVPPVAPSSVPRSIPPTPTVTALAFPNALISISSFTPGGAFESSRLVSSIEGYFNIALKSGGNTSYGIVATDVNGDASPAKVFSFNLDIGGLITDLNIVVAPTIRLLRDVLTRGDNLVVSGYTFPKTSVRAFVDGVQKGGVAHTDESGRYRILINTADLEFGTHTVAVNETFSDGTSSENSLLRAFTISQVFTPQADFNGDGRVDIQDWSVFLSKWNAPGGSALNLDLNGDGFIDIADFSIMLRAVQR